MEPDIKVKGFILALLREVSTLYYVRAKKYYILEDVKDMSLLYTHKRRILTAMNVS